MNVLEDSHRVFRGSSRDGLTTGVGPIALALFVCMTSTLSAHEGIHEQIDQVSQQIRKRPADAQLRLQRGELYRLHEQWDRAIADYAEAGKLDPKLSGVDLARGMLEMDRGNPKAARTHLDRFIEREPASVDGHLARARILVRLGEPASAVRDYERAISLSDPPRPDWYVELAHADLATGRNGAARALAHLDSGIAQLGPIVTLQLAAIDIDVSLSHFDPALARLDTILAQSPRKETWLVRRADILEAADRSEEARGALEKALAAIESLPEAQRSSRATRELENEIRARLSR